MAVAAVSTITAASTESWQDATRQGIARANETLRNITGVKMIEEKASVEDGEITEYRVTLQVIFLLEDTLDTNTAKE